MQIHKNIISRLVVAVFIVLGLSLVPQLSQPNTAFAAIPRACPAADLKQNFPETTETIGYIKSNEGFCASTFRDLSGDGYVIGFGHWCSDSVGNCAAGNRMTESEATDLLMPDIDTARRHAENLTASWANLSSQQQTVLIDMCYQMGWNSAVERKINQLGGVAAAATSRNADLRSFTATQSKDGCNSFVKMRNALNQGDLNAAANEITSSNLAGQTRNRAERGAALMRGDPLPVAQVGTSQPSVASSPTTTSGGVSIGSDGQITVDLELSLATRQPRELDNCSLPQGCLNRARVCAQSNGVYNPDTQLCTIDGMHFRPVLHSGKLDGKPYADVWMGQWLQVISGASGEDIITSYAGFMFRFLAGTIGVIATLMLAVGGIQIVTAGSNQEGMQQGKDRMIAALAGMAVLFLSSLVLYTINPNFFRLSEPLSPDATVSARIDAEGDELLHAAATLPGCDSAYLADTLTLSAIDIDDPVERALAIDLASASVATQCSRAALEDLRLELATCTEADITMALAATERQVDLAARQFALMCSSADAIRDLIFAPHMSDAQRMFSSSTSGS